MPLTVRFHVLAEHIDALVIDGRDHFVDAQGTVLLEMHIGDGNGIYFYQLTHRGGKHTPKRIVLLR